MRPTPAPAARRGSERLDLVEVPTAPLERRHPWETARFAFFRDVLRRRGLLAPGARVLEIGAGDGWLATRLAALPERPEVVASDVAYAEGAPGERDGVRFVRTPPRERFDLVLLLDVIEHVEDDGALLAEAARAHLAPGGHVLVSVPAWPWLFGPHDERLRHLRRYTPRRARAALQGAGLEPVLAGGLFHALLPVRAALNLVERRGGGRAAHAGEWSGSPGATAALGALLALEGRGSLWLAERGLDLPGLSWWALCRPRAS